MRQFLHSRVCNFSSKKEIGRNKHHSLMKDEATHINETLRCTHEYREFLLAVASHLVNEYPRRRFESNAIGSSAMFWHNRHFPPSVMYTQHCTLHLLISISELNNDVSSPISATTMTEMNDRWRWRIRCVNGHPMPHSLRNSSLIDSYFGIQLQFNCHLAAQWMIML